MGSVHKAFCACGFAADVTVSGDRCTVFSRTLPSLSIVKTVGLSASTLQR